MANIDGACIVCMKKVLDDEKAIGCDGHCERWFHIDCIKMSPTEYAKFAGNKKLKWNCSRVDCAEAVRGPMVQLITQIADLTGKMDLLIKKVDSLKNDDIVPIREDIKDLSVKISALEPRLAASETRISALEESLRAVGTSGGHTDAEFVIGELNDRSQRAANVLVYNLKEPTSTSPRERQNQDNQHINHLVSALDVNLDTDRIKSFRLGKPVRGKIRPLKVVFGSANDAKTFNTTFSKDLVSTVDAEYEGLSIGRDRTLKERQYLKKIRNELDERKKNGEVSLTIKYINGVPNIVKSLSKNE